MYGHKFSNCIEKPKKCFSVFSAQLLNCTVTARIIARLDFISTVQYMIYFIYIISFLEFYYLLIVRTLQILLLLKRYFYIMSRQIDPGREISKLTFVALALRNERLTLETSAFKFILGGQCTVP